MIPDINPWPHTRTPVHESQETARSAQGDISSKALCMPYLNECCRECRLGSLFYRSGNWGSGGLDNSLQVSQPVCGRTGIKTQGGLTPAPAL